MLESSKNNDEVKSILLYRPVMRENIEGSDQSTLDTLMCNALDFLVSGLKIHKVPGSSNQNWGASLRPGPIFYDFDMILALRPHKECNFPSVFCILSKNHMGDPSNF